MYINGDKIKTFTATLVKHKRKQTRKCDLADKGVHVAVIQ